MSTNCCDKYKPEYIGHVNTHDYNKVVKKLREFFDSRGFEEVHTQSRLGIMAICEDPKNVMTYDILGMKWGLPQTGQGFLEYELMKDPSVKGYFCMTTSYRNEPNPVAGRHDLLFPLFEFETFGGIDDLEKLERELLEFLGFGKANEFSGGNYLDIAKNYGVKELDHAHEEQLEKDHGSVFFIKNFPEYTSPYFNMKRSEDGQTAKKIDVIIGGMETIGSAERSCDVAQMKNSFHTISNGEYAGLLYGHFGKERVEKELEEFFSLNFFQRCGGGIGITRLIKAMKKYNLL